MRTSIDRISVESAPAIETQQLSKSFGEGIPAVDILCCAVNITLAALGLTAATRAFAAKTNRN